MRDILGKVASVATGVVVAGFNAVRDAVANVTSWLQGLWDKSESIRSFFADAFAAGIGALTAAFGQLRAAVDWLWSSIQRVIDAAQTAVDWVSKIPGVSSLTGGSSAGAYKFAPSGGDKLRLDGTRAGGGPVRAGLSYLVGERGPEILTMGGSNGFVSAGGGVSTGGPTYQINITTMDARGVKEVVIDALTSLERRDGRLPLRSTG